MLSLRKHQWTKEKWYLLRQSSSVCIKRSLNWWWNYSTGRAQAVSLTGIQVWAMQVMTLSDIFRLWCFFCTLFLILTWHYFMKSLTSALGMETIFSFKWWSKKAVMEGEEMLLFPCCCPSLQKHSVWNSETWCTSHRTWHSKTPLRNGLVTWSLISAL